MKRHRYSTCAVLALALGAYFALALVTQHPTAALEFIDDEAKDTPATEPQRLKIDKIYFMFHPTCWRQSGPKAPAGVAQDKWTACFDWEVQVNEQQKAFMDQMKPNEALVMFPIGASPPMKDLERHGTKVLGRRCIIMRRRSVDPSPEWANLDDPFKSFLEDDNLAGKAKFLQSIPADVQTELADEIREARTALGTDWSIGVFEVIYYSRMCAEDVKNEFAQRHMVYDPAKVESEAFGEGFEQCAMTWKSMLVPYMGLQKPAYNIYDLSVTGAVFLRQAEFRERVALRDGIQLFLWEGKEGGHIGFYARAWCRLKDPQFWVHVPLEDMSLEAWGLEKYGTKHWPAEGSPLKTEDDHLQVPILNGIRRDGTDGTYYLIAKGIDFKDFRRRLVEARITP